MPQGAASTPPFLENSMPTQQELVLQFLLAFASNSHITQLMHDYNNSNPAVVINLANEWANAYLKTLG
jgi:hypothetical protein